jgi:peptidoglycan hydrolase-like protein with peptidoglycan-binding domain
MSDVFAINRRSRRPKGIFRGFSVVVILCAVLAAGIAVGWAVRVVFAAPAPVTAATYTIVTVQQGKVSSSQRANVVAVWARTPAAVNRAVGTVTAVAPPATGPVAAGTTLYWVDLHPGVAISGAVPAFRTMGPGLAGDDIAQLQAYLSTAGFLRVTEDGTWSDNTTDAVKAWQATADMPVDGVVDLGEVIFVSAMPARLVVDPTIITVGAQLQGAEHAVDTVPPEPTFTLPLAQSQTASISVGNRVEITSPTGSTWQAWITGQDAPDVTAGSVTFALSGAANGDVGTSICGDECGSVTLDSNGALLLSQVITVEEVVGLVVPSAAVLTTAAGTTVLIGEDGTEIPVTVLAGARGMTAVTGVSEGLRVRAPARAP